MLSTVHSKYSHVTVHTIPLSSIGKVDIVSCRQPQSTLEEYYASATTKPDVLINGGFFSIIEGTPYFNLTDNGEMRSVSTENTLGLSIENGNVLTCRNSNEVTDGADFISGYPVLVANSEKQDVSAASDINFNTRRTAVGFNHENLIIVIAEMPGVKLEVLQDIFVENKAVGAFNLDGGGSTRMLVGGKVTTKQDWSRPIDNALAIYLGKGGVVSEAGSPTVASPAISATASSGTFYRVQVGAFALAENANAKLEEMHAAGFINTQIFKKELYVVQVGAFAQKANAVSLSEQIKAAGFDVYITE